MNLVYWHVFPMIIGMNVGLKKVIGFYADKGDLVILISSSG